jgi:hypothetical protein
MYQGKTTIPPLIRRSPNSASKEGEVADNDIKQQISFLFLDKLFFLFLSFCFCFELHDYHRVPTKRKDEIPPPFACVRACSKIEPYISAISE